MTWADHVMDATLCAALPLLAWGATAAGDRSRQAILFIAFGLLASLAWARLDAPDVALVEASVGAGLTGALLMASLSWLPREDHPKAAAGAARARVPLWLGSAGLIGVLGVVLLEVPTNTVGLREHVLAALPMTGVTSPVTAVLLNLRGYDTILEIAVLVVVGVATLAEPAARSPSPAQSDAPLPGLVRMLAPGIVLVAGYLLWRGSHAPGGAFQAGSILGGGVILLLLARGLSPPGRRSIVARLFVVGGLLVFVAVAAAPLLLGGALLQYPRAHAGGLILLVESALTLSIGAILAFFFQATRSRDGES